ncbi:hypothetical protein KIS4809_3056 [Bacillus sp. ZZV12-4809]|nr:hypothetical protein KIS4809_3056 [Bacillus sp. ZZV12-4809]
MVISEYKRYKVIILYLYILYKNYNLFNLKQKGGIALTSLHLRTAP